jgi:Cu(I)/Ag(I) efflux system membrane protein CusA/SilA
MVPMAVPLFGGMTIAMLTMFVVPVLYSLWQEGIIKRELKKQKA